MTIRRAVIACAAALAVAGCTPADAEPEIDTAPAVQEVEVEVDPVLESIESLTDCTALQDQFELAFNGSEQAEPGSAQHQASVARMDAADERLKAVGCYE